LARKVAHRPADGVGVTGLARDGIDAADLPEKCCKYREFAAADASNV
jgi:hypothetical protein